MLLWTPASTGHKNTAHGWMDEWTKWHWARFRGSKEATQALRQNINNAVHKLLLLYASADWLNNKLINYQTDYVEQSLYWKANIFSASPGIPHLLWQPKFHCRVYKSQLHVPVLSQIIPVFHRLLPNSFKIHLDITIWGLRGLPSGLYLSRL